MQPDDPKFASQKLVYEQVGKDMLEHAFEGLAYYTYLCCVYSYNNIVMISNDWIVIMLCSQNCNIMLFVIHLVTYVEYNY